MPTIDELQSKADALTQQSVNLQDQIGQLQDLQHKILVSRDECYRLISVANDGDIPIDPPEAEQAATMLTAIQASKPTPIEKKVAG